MYSHQRPIDAHPATADPAPQDTLGATLAALTGVELPTA